MVLQPLGEGVFCRLAKTPRKRRNLSRRQVLVAEDQHLMVEKGCMDGVEGGIIETGQIEMAAVWPGNLGSKRAGDRRDRQVEFGAVHFHHLPDTGLVPVPQCGSPGVWPLRAKGRVVK
jgi:hypothetical protein